MCLETLDDYGSFHYLFFGVYFLYNMTPVTLFLQTLKEHDRAKTAAYAVRSQHERLCTLRARAVEWLRARRRAEAVEACDRTFVRRYSADLSPLRNGFIKAKLRAKMAAYVEDRARGFVQAQKQASIQAFLSKGDERAQVLAAESERARLFSLNQKLIPLERQFTEEVHSLPTLLSLDEEISACASAREERYREERLRSEKEHRELLEWRAAQRKSREKQREKARKESERDRIVSLLEMEQDFCAKADRRSRRVLSNFVHLCLLMGVPVQDGPQRAYSTWCAQVGNRLGEHGDSFMSDVWQQLWDKIEILSTEGDVVKAHVDQSPFITEIHMPPKVSSEEPLTGFLAEVGSELGLTSSRYKLNDIRFVRSHRVAEMIVSPFPYCSGETLRHLKYKREFVARVLRLKTLPWHYLKRKRK